MKDWIEGQAGTLFTTRDIESIRIEEFQNITNHSFKKLMLTLLYKGGRECILGSFADLPSVEKELKDLKEMIGLGNIHKIL